MSTRLIGDLAFNAFPSRFGLACDLSLRLDRSHPLGLDYQIFLQNLGYSYDWIAFMGEKYTNPTCIALTTAPLCTRPLRQIVAVLMDMEREDCVEVISQAIIAEIAKRNGNDEQNIPREVTEDIQSVLSMNAALIQQNSDQDLDFEDIILGDLHVIGRIVEAIVPITLLYLCYLLFMR